MPAICFEAIVLSQETLAENIRLLTVLWPDDAHAPHAGQFFTLRAWAPDEAPFLSRPISVHSWAPETHALQFLYQIKGAGTEQLARLKTGGRIQLTGPMGNGFDAAALAAQYRRILLVGGGIGTAPLYQLARELAAAGTLPDAAFGFQDMPYATACYRGVTRRVKVATDSGKAGVHGLVTQLYAPEAYDVILVCGPAPMMKAVAAGAKAAGVPCFCSMEGKMACGIGACLGCTCKTTRGEAVSICKNGPVFCASDIF
ncbi:MAG: dihydroorotate dehydrogenase electron transfer subunit [Faecalibacterium sp.]|jgi:dihydroorotate dehydrogenase electron transfer subunit|nr:dihydroorotate dehydrogenase electron transfer subunit [Faecalibacterium sp.]